MKEMMFQQQSSLEVTNLNSVTDVIDIEKFIFYILKFDFKR